MIQVRLKWEPARARTSEEELAIVVDILRGSTTTTTCLQYGAEYIIPTIEVKTAFELAEEYDALLVGERDNLKIDGFDLGNSPAEVTGEIVKGRKIIFTSTSFPRAIEAAKNMRMYTTSRLNLSAFLTMSVLSC